MFKTFDYLMFCVCFLDRQSNRLSMFLALMSRPFYL